MGSLFIDLQSWRKHNIAEKICKEYYKRYMASIGKDISGLIGFTSNGFEGEINRGCCGGTYYYQCVIYKTSTIAVFEAKTSDDVISAGFSGCYMATFTYMNKRYVAHIAMDSNSTTKTNWNKAVQDGTIQNITLLNHLLAFLFPNIRVYGE